MELRTVVHSIVSRTMFSKEDVLRIYSETYNTAVRALSHHYSLATDVHEYASKVALNHLININEAI